MDEHIECEACGGANSARSVRCVRCGQLLATASTHRDEESLTGCTLGKYELGPLIARGARGELYRAKHVLMRRVVALKVLAAEFTRDEASRSRFLAEGRALARLEHAHVATVYDVGEDEGRLFLAMALQDGPTLRHRIGEGPLSLEDVVRIGRELASALDAAHERGVVHRDLKPENVVFSTEGSLKLVDFGLAKLSDSESATMSGAVLGTVPYLAPEQLRGGEIDKRCDLWSLGVLMFESMTGTLPFEPGENGLVDAVLSSTARSLADERPDAPAELVALVAELLATDPEGRPASAAAVEARLALVAGDSHDTPGGQRQSDPVSAPGHGPSSPSLPPTSTRSSSPPAARRQGTLSSGQIIGDRFRLVEELGRGGMGSVWRAEHLVLSAPCAIKFIREDVALPEARKRFVEEARTLAKLKSDHVVHVLDAGVALGRPYIAMELLEGETLDERLRRERQLPSAMCVRILRELAKGLDAAHARGIIHRDLKPANIFLAKTDHGEVVKIVDFGISKADLVAGVAGGEDAPSVIGTPGFMSPEQLEPGQRVDHRADLWALAVIGFRVLTGRRPFPATNVRELSREVVREPAKRIRDFLPDAPPEVDAWFSRGASPDRESRFQSAAEMVGALDRALHEGGARESLRSSTPATDGDDRTDPRTTAATILRTLEERAAGGVLEGWGALALVVVALVASAGFALRLSASRAAAERNLDTAEPVVAKPTPAETTYEHARRLWKAGSFRASRRLLAEALALDPGFAPAALRLALDLRPSEDARRLLRSAMEYRERLSPDDAALLDASAGAAAPSPDLGAWEARLVERVEAAPSSSSAEVHIVLAQVRSLRGDIPGALRALAAAEQVDPAMGPACAALRGRLERERYAFDAALAAYDDCMNLSPNATECMFGKARILALRGRCGEVEELGHRWMAADQDDPGGYDVLAVGLAAGGAPIAAIEETLNAKWEKQRNDVSAATYDLAPTPRWIDRYRLSVLRGDFESAVAEARAALDAVPASAGLIAHYEPSWWLALAAREGGYDDVAIEVSNRFVERARAWTPDNPRHVGAPLLFLVMLRLLNGISEEDFQAQRSHWLELADRAVQRAGKAVDPYTRAFPWIAGYGVSANSPKHAEEALAALPQYEPLPAPGGREGDVDLVIGNVYAYGGKPELALPYYEGAANSCLLLENPFAWLFGQMGYGRALADLGQLEEARARLNTVIRYWGSAKPKSKRAKDARTLLSKLDRR